MNDMTTTRMLMTTAVLAAVAALLAGPAHAMPVDPDGETGIVVVTAPAMAVPDDGGTGGAVVTAPETAQVTIGPGVIPYMSHGIGVDESLFSGEPQQSLGLTGDSALTRQQSTPTDVHGALYRDRSAQAGAAPAIEPGSIPYMSHGIGVDESLFSGEPQQSLGLTGDSALTRVGLSDQAAATGHAASSGSDTDWTWIGVGGGMAALLAAALAGLYFSARNRDRVALP